MVALQETYIKTVSRDTISIYAPQARHQNCSRVAARACGITEGQGGGGVIYNGCRVSPSSVPTTKRW